MSNFCQYGSGKWRNARFRYGVKIIAPLLFLSCYRDLPPQKVPLIDIYYPLKNGYTWSYIEKEYSLGVLYTRRITHRITGEKIDRDKSIFNTNPEGLFAIYDRDGVAKSGALVVKDPNGVGITIRTKNDMPLYPSKLYYLLKNPLIKGNSWRNRVSIFDIPGQRFEIVSTNAVVELENGLRFKDCIEVLSNYTSDGRRYTGRQWFAPNIGLVRSTQERHTKEGNVLVYELYLSELPEFLDLRPETK